MKRVCFQASAPRFWNSIRRRWHRALRRMHMAESKGRRIGVLTSGGDAPGLNAVIRAVVKASNHYGLEVLGFEGGFEGLLGEGTYRVLSSADVRGLLPRGGTILGTTNKGHFGPRVRTDPENDPY